MKSLKIKFKFVFILGFYLISDIVFTIRTWSISNCSSLIA